jgi:hypothetical protein
MLQAQDWRGRYNANDVSGVAEIYSLLAKAAGCSTGVTAIEMQRADCLSIMNRIVNDMAAGNLYGEDPLNKRSKEFKGFKTNFLQFVDHCIREASETGDLYDGTLFLSWLEIISTSSSCSGNIHGFASHHELGCRREQPQQIARFEAKPNGYCYAREERQRDAQEFAECRRRLSRTN